MKSESQPMRAETTSQSTRSLPDSPGVIIFPPLLPLGTLLLSSLLTFLWPLHFPASIWLKVAGAVLFMCGIGLAGWGRNTMMRAGTNVPPNKPTLVIVSDGPFRFTRNPLYIGGTCVYFGMALGFGGRRNGKWNRKDRTTGLEARRNCRNDAPSRCSPIADAVRRAMEDGKEESQIEPEPRARIENRKS